MQPSLYLVYLEAPPLRDPSATADMIELMPGLYLVETGQTRSQLYHSLKRRFDPVRLLVAPMAQAPKFKGMAPGVQKWLRGQGYE